MGRVFKKKVTKAVPTNAVVSKGYATWTDRHGTKRKERVKTVKGKTRIVIESPYYVARYRDADGIIREESTGCKDRQAAERVLSELERKAELIKSGVMSPTEAKTAEHAAVPLTKHFDAFEQQLIGKDVSAVYRANVLSALTRVSDECGYRKLSDLRAEPFESWLAERVEEGMSARSRNAYREALVCFGNWCVRTKRLAVNPFAGVVKANTAEDPRRRRRALTEDELTRLLTVAQSRPIHDARLAAVKAGQSHRSRKLARGTDPPERTTKPVKQAHEVTFTPEREAELMRKGRERALIYKTLVLTGLRKGELASLTVSQLRSDADVAYLELDAADAKDGKDARLPLRADLAADLRSWLAESLEAAREAARRVKGRSPTPCPRPPSCSPSRGPCTGFLTAI
jgi:integrase